jgi:hypothetical protein
MKQGFLAMLATGNYGRFMNGGYQIAAVLGIAKKNNLEPCFNPWVNADHRDRFGSTEDVDLGKYFVHQLPPIPESIIWQAERGYGWGYQDIVLPPGNWNISGHFQSPKYFDDCRDQVSHYFRMIGEPPQNDYCSIHYRAQDYDQGTNAGYHPRMSLAYYEPAMAHFGSDQQFLVFSDDIPGAKELFRPLEGKHKIAYSEGLDYIQDFKRLKRCASFIIANSSYSAMAAVLGDAPDKQVIAPRPWFGKAAGGLTGEDIYDVGWKIINWA